jgi:glutamine cyclotransferase
MGVIMHMYVVALVAAIGVLAVSSQSSGSATTSRSRSSVKSYELLSTVPHDTTCFTQGLEYHNGLLYER